MAQNNFDSNEVFTSLDNVSSMLNEILIPNDVFFGGRNLAFTHGIIVYHPKTDQIICVYTQDGKMKWNDDTQEFRKIVRELMDNEELCIHPHNRN